MKDIELKGALEFKLGPSQTMLSERMKQALFNKRDEGYYFRKFSQEKRLELGVAADSPSGTPRKSDARRQASSDQRLLPDKLKTVIGSYFEDRSPNRGKTTIDYGVLPLIMNQDFIEISS